MNSRPICKPEVHVVVDDFIWLLTVLSDWYPYLIRFHQLIFLQNSILI